MGGIIFKTTTRGGKSGGASIPDGSIDKSKLSPSVQKSLTAADGAVRFDAAQELTVAQMERALLNLGLKFMVITNNEIGKVLSEERRAKLEQAEAVLFDTTNFHKVLLRGDDTSVHTKFVALVDSSRYYEATYNKSTYILSSISASRIIDSNAVRFNVPQSITTSQQEQVFANLGLKVVYINLSEFRTTLTEERANEILQADICIATYNGHQYAFYFSGRATTGLSYFTTLQSNENVLRFTVSDTFALSAIVIAKFVGGGSVRYDTTQNLTTSQQLQVRKNIDGMKNTPSGDPMHYIYETAGAEWIPYADISTEGLEDWQVETLDRVQAQADNGVWWHNDIFVTVEQNRINYVSTVGNYPANSTTYAFYLKRTNVTTNYKEDILVNNNISLSEAVRISGTIRTVLLPTMTTNNIGYAFNNCARLCRVIGTINVSNVSSFSNTFVASPNLRYINLYGLNMNVDFSGNGKLSLKSLIFMITNAGTASFTITLAPAVYAAAMADTAVQAALASKPNVTLADAGATGGEN